MDKSDIQETLVSLYLRLNGYFVSSFIVHAVHGVGTEIDILAIRFPRHAEPEREVQPCEHLAIPPGCVDFIVGEVKRGLKNVNFNEPFRKNRKKICTVLRRFGAFCDAEIERVCTAVPGLLEPANVSRSATFPELDVALAGDVGMQAKLRFVPFAAEQCRPATRARPYVFEDDLLAFVWKCFRPEHQRPCSDVHYDYDLWGPQFEVAAM
ncbi:MAG: hypothetical protein Q8P22_06040 [Chloroflexota bacterium]|nr:hypothetical protein [Chloroflexota bacterium]